MSFYIHELASWPRFEWEHDRILAPLTEVRNKQGRLLGRLEAAGFQLRTQASLESITQEIIRSSEIEGEVLPVDQVRSSVARRLGIEQAGEIAISRVVEGVVEMMIDATQQNDQELTGSRLFAWHVALFPTGRSGIKKIKVGTWRDDAKGPMQVVSGPIGKERVHFQAPDATRLTNEMDAFLNWFNGSDKMDPVLKAAVAHLWFVTIHPFDDGNGRIARAITEMQLARADGTKQRFYSMSAQIQRDRNSYYSILERTQKGEMNITVWLLWFIESLAKAISASDNSVTYAATKAEFWEKHQLVAVSERQRKMLNRLLDGFDGKLTSSKWAKITKCSADTALRDIQDLISKQLLEKEKGGGRSTSYRLREE